MLILTDESLHNIKLLGENIEIARCRRKLSRKIICERARITQQTYRRLVNGDPGVSIGVMMSVIQSMNMEHLMLNLLDPDQDEHGKALDNINRNRRFVGDGNELDTNF